MYVDQKTFHHRIFDVLWYIQLSATYISLVTWSKHLLIWEDFSSSGFLLLVSLSGEVGYGWTVCWMDSTRGRQISGELSLSVLGQHLGRKGSIPAGRSTRCCHKHMIVRHCAIYKDITVSEWLLVTYRHLQRLGGHLDSRKLSQPWTPLKHLFMAGPKRCESL